MSLPQQAVGAPTEPEPDASPLHRRHLTVAGLDLAYLERGTPTSDTPSLILLHGLMGCAATMAPLMLALPPSIHVLALDLPGAGKSVRSPTIDATLAATAALVASFASALGISDFCLLGHSHGGAVGLQLAAIYPKTLRSLVLIAPAHPYFQEANPLIRFYLTLPGRLFAYSMPWYPKWVQMIGLRRMAGPQSWDTVEKLKPYRENLRTPGTMAHLLRLLTTWHQDMAALGKLLRKPLTTPTQLIWGDSDRAVPPISVVELRARIDYSELHILRGVGHRPAEERPVEVAALLADWLTRPAHTHYNPNSAVSQSRIAALNKPSFVPGEFATPAKK